MTYKLSRKKTQPLDPFCKKTVYDSEEKAKEMVKHLKEEKNIKVRYYQCLVCKLWHLTSE